MAASISQSAIQSGRTNIYVYIYGCADHTCNKHCADSRQLLINIDKRNAFTILIEHRQSLHQSYQPIMKYSYYKHVMYVRDLGAPIITNLRFEFSINWPLRKTDNKM